MFGDPFFTAGCTECSSSTKPCFRPHVRGSFFHMKAIIGLNVGIIVFSSPCLEILFSLSFTSKESLRMGNRFRPHVWGFFFHMTEEEQKTLMAYLEFSSPCLGILFSQQAWDAPRGRLSMALLRRGFPIDWNSHDFHSLTFCFLRFHAHRRGFSK